MSDEFEAIEDIDVSLPDEYGAVSEDIPFVVTHMNSIIGSAFRAANDKRARSHQKALGMSELGGCRRQAGFKINGTPETNPANERTDIFADSREAMIGTMIHDTVLPQIAAMSMTAEIEVPVVLKFDDLPAIPGHADMVDESTLVDLKCLAIDTPILMANGRVLRADEIKTEDRVVAYDQIHNQLMISYVEDVQENGDRPTIEITTASGRVLEVTEEHPVWIKRSEQEWGEWVRADEVEIGMLATLALAAPIEDQHVPELGADEPWLLGLLAAVQFRPEDIPALGIDSMAQTVAMNSVSLMGEEAVRDMWARHSWISAHVPTVPDEIILAGVRVWQEWLSGFSAKAMDLGLGEARWAVADRKMAEQVASMLAGLGIKAVIERGQSDAYALRVGPDDYGLRRLSDALWLRGTKGVSLRQLADRLTNPERPEHYELDPVVRVLLKPDPTRTLAITVAEHHTFVTAGLVTHNTVGSNSARYYQTHGASKKHLWQTHGYAQALRNAGHDIEHVALAYVDRSNGQVVHIHYQPFDQGIVDDIEYWWTEVNAAKDPMDLPRDERGPGISRTCDWCVEPSTKVLLPNYTWRAAEDIEIGDTIMGWSEPSGGSPGKLVPTKVTMSRRRIAPLVRVNGDLTVAEGKKFHTRFGWRGTQVLEGKDVKFVTAPIKRDQAMYERGWLAGMAQGDGTFWWARNRNGENAWRQFRLAVKDDADILLGRFEEYAANAGFATRRRDHTHTSFNGVTSKMPAIFLRTDADARGFEEWINETPDDESWTWGYLGGITDAEGCVTGKSGTIRISQYAHKKTEIYNRIGDALHRLGFNPTAEWNGWCLKSRSGELFRFLAGATPGRPQFTNLGLNRAPWHSTRVHEVTPAGEGEVVSLTTETGSYIAEGYVVHNCPWLTACWGPDAKPGETGVQKVIVHEASDENEAIEASLMGYAEATAAEKEAVEAKKYHRSVLTGVENGRYGAYILAWGKDGTYEVLDADSAEAALVAAGLPVPKIVRSKQGAIRVKRA